MRILSATACLVVGVLGAVAVAPLAAQSTPRAATRDTAIPTALAAVREADLRRDAGGWRGPGHPVSWHPRVAGPV